MIGNTSSSFFTRMRRKFFNWRVDSEIHDRIFPHHRGEKDFGYPFRNRAEMQQHTEELEVSQLLEAVEKHIQHMPAAYGESFRYIMHRDLQQRLAEFENLARRRVRPAAIDPRFVATHA
jgi:hypothetical protein